MPASELEWASFPQGPIFQVFGNKRKADTSSGEPCQEVFGAKRHCQWGEDHAVKTSPGQSPEQAAMVGPVAGAPCPDGEPHPSNNNNNNGMMESHMPVGPASAHGGCVIDSDMSEINQNSLGQMNRHQAVNPALSHILSQQPPRVPSPWPSHQLPAAQSQHSANDMIMDLNDETYNPRAGLVAEAEAACMAMDSDCSPDPQQYASNNRSSSDETFCKNFCGAGQASPTSGLVRCYCKPSWEGMMDLKPYISDVY